MAVSNRVKTTLPAIPKVTVSDRNLQRFCDSVTQYCAIHGGNVGSGLDRAITAREMINLGFASWKQTRPNQPGGGSGGTLVPLPPDIPDVVEPPTKPKGFKVISGTVAILLVWDDVDFKGAGSTEVWRNTKPEFSTAANIITTPAAVYSDIPDGDDLYYYWIRHTNKNGDKGAISEMKSGQAGLLTSNPDGDTMLVSDLVAYAIYATELTAVHVRGGDMDFAGGRFTVDVNGNCTASSLTINTGGYARSANYAMDTAGWAIFGDGSVEFNDGVFRGTIYADDGVFGGSIYADKIIGDLVASKSYALSNLTPDNLWHKLAEINVTNNTRKQATILIGTVGAQARAASNDATDPLTRIEFQVHRSADMDHLVGRTESINTRIDIYDGENSSSSIAFSPQVAETMQAGDVRVYSLWAKLVIVASADSSYSLANSNMIAQLFRDGSAFS